MKILSVVGARPNFMKIAPLARAIKTHKNVKHIIVHTGQHYDHKMSKSFFEDLDIPKPNINLEVGSGSHAVQTAEVMLRFEKVVLMHKPDVVVVVGDVNSTIACSLVATKLRIPVAHIEAGLRSNDRNMPEETNRLLTDSISDMLFTTCLEANKNLLSEGVPKDRMFFVGNVMIDTLLNNIKKAERSNAVQNMCLKKKGYALVTLHRPSNVDDRTNIKVIFSAINEVQKRIKVVFPIHPRTRKNFAAFGLTKMVNSMRNLVLTEPLGYFEFLNLMMNSKLVLTDSGGIQEETTVLKIPCLTIRENTERPITVTEGSNVLVGVDKNKIIRESIKVLNGYEKKCSRPKYWDGKASERIVKKLMSLYKQKRLLRS